MAFVAVALMLAVAIVGTTSIASEEQVDANTIEWNGSGSYSTKNEDSLSGNLTIQDNGVLTLTEGVTLDLSGHKIINNGVIKVEDESGLLIALGQNGKVELGKDIDRNGAEKLKLTTEIELNLNGHDITNSNGVFTIYGGSLTVIGDGTIKTTAHSSGASAIMVGGWLGEGGTDVDGKLILGTGSDNPKIMNDKGYGIFVAYQSEVTVNSATIKSCSGAISGNGSVTNGQAKYGATSLTINGGTFTATDGAAIYLPSTNNVTINGGSFEGLTGIESRASSTIIKNCSIKATGNFTNEVNKSNGSTEWGIGIAIIDNPNYKATTDIEFNISDVEFDAGNKINIYVGDMCGKTNTSDETKIQFDDTKLNEGYTASKNITVTIDDNITLETIKDKSSGRFTFDCCTDCVEFKNSCVIKSDNEMHIVGKVVIPTGIVITKEGKITNNGVIEVNDVEGFKFAVSVGGNIKIVEQLVINEEISITESANITAAVDNAFKMVDNGKITVSGNGTDVTITGTNGRVIEADAKNTQAVIEVKDEATLKFTQDNAANTGSLVWAKNKSAGINNMSLRFIVNGATLNFENTGSVQASAMQITNGKVNFTNYYSIAADLYLEMDNSSQLNVESNKATALGINLLNAIVAGTVTVDKSIFFYGGGADDAGTFALDGATISAAKFAKAYANGDVTLSGSKTLSGEFVKGYYKSGKIVDTKSSKFINKDDLNARNGLTINAGVVLTSEGNVNGGTINLAEGETITFDTGSEFNGTINAENNVLSGKFQASAETKITAGSLYINGGLKAISPGDTVTVKGDNVTISGSLDNGVKLVIEKNADKNSNVIFDDFTSPANTVEGFDNADMTMVGNVTIADLPYTITNNNALTYNGNQQEMLATISFDSDKIDSWKVTEEGKNNRQGTDAGEYIVTYEYILKGKTEKTILKVTWVILPQEITVTNGEISKVYDGSETVNGGYTVSEGINLNVSSAKYDNKNVNENKDVILTFTFTNESKMSNYKFMLDGVELAPVDNTIILDGKITPLEITFESDPVDTKEYDGTTNYNSSNYSITNSIEALMKADGVVLSAEFSDANVATSSKQIVFTLNVDPDAANYTLPANVNATITVATITVTPNANQSKVYGTADKAFTYGYAGVQNSEVPGFNGALSRATGDSVGDYNITIGNLALVDKEGFTASNYELEINSTPVAFKITKAKLDTPTGMAWNGFTASWSTVSPVKEDTVSYLVQLYDDESKVGEAQSTNKTSFDFESMMSETGAYTFTVVAVTSDTEHANINDSSESDKSGVQKVWTVTFDRNGHGTAPVAQYVIDGTKATEPGVMTETGYAFDKWKNGNDDYSFEANVTADINLKAEWKLNNPVINTEPVVITANYDGDDRTLTVKAETDGAGDLEYQWYKGSSPISGATNATYTVKDVEDSGSYHVVITATDGTLTSSKTSGTVAVTISKVSLKDPTGMAWNGFTASWSTVSPVKEDTVSYLVQLYDDESKVGGAQSTSDTSLDFRSMMNATGEYTFTVVAVTSDTEHANINDSSESAKSGGQQVYTVTFDENGHGAETNSQYIISGENVTMPAALVATGYEFNGWKVGDTDTILVGGATCVVSSDVTMTAQWTLEKPSVSISPNAVSGEYDGTSKQIVVTPSHAANGIKYTYSWTGGTISLGNVDRFNVMNVADSGTYTVTVTATDGRLSNTQSESITVTISKVNITVNDISAVVNGENTFEFENIKDGVTHDDIVEKLGLKFTTVNGEAKIYTITSSDATGDNAKVELINGTNGNANNYTIVISPEAKLTITSDWTITFEEWIGLKYSESQTINTESDSTKSAMLPFAKEEQISVGGKDYNFMGWTDVKPTAGVEGVVKYQPLTYITVSTNMTLYAVYKEVTSPETVDITFQQQLDDGEVKDIGTMNVLKNSTIYLQAMSIEGYKFDGWFVGAEPEGKIGNYVVGDENVTLIAKFTKISEETYTVTFDYNEGVAGTISLTVSAGESIVLPTTSKVGNTFLGWKVGETETILGAGQLYTVTGGVTFTAQWDVDEVYFTVTLDNGFGSVSEVSVKSGETYTLPELNVPFGYKDAYWTLEGEEITSPTDEINSDCTYVAVFVKDTFTVTVNITSGDNGSVVAPSELLNGQYGIFVTVPVRGYEVNEVISTNAIVTEIAENTYYFTSKDGKNVTFEVSFKAIEASEDLDIDIVNVSKVVDGTEIGGFKTTLAAERGLIPAGTFTLRATYTYMIADEEGVSVPAYDGVEVTETRSAGEGETSKELSLYTDGITSVTADKSLVYGFAYFTYGDENKDVISTEKIVAIQVETPTVPVSPSENSATA